MRKYRTRCSATQDSQEESHRARVQATHSQQPTLVLAILIFLVILSSKSCLRGVGKLLPGQVRALWGDHSDNPRHFAEPSPLDEFSLRCHKPSVREPGRGEDPHLTDVESEAETGLPRSGSW